MMTRFVLMCFQSSFKLKILLMNIVAIVKMRIPIVTIEVRSA